MSPTLDLDDLQLAEGKHDSPADGGCVMEWASYLADEPWSDHPACVSPAIAAFCRSWNDVLPDEDRNRLLKPFLTKVIGTNTGPDDEHTRGLMAADWLVRTFAPAWLHKCGLPDDAAALAQLDALTSVELVNAALPIIRRAREQIGRASCRERV